MGLYFELMRDIPLRWLFFFFCGSFLLFFFFFCLGAGVFVLFSFYAVHIMSCFFFVRGTYHIALVRPDCPRALGTVHTISDDPFKRELHCIVAQARRLIGQGNKSRPITRPIGLAIGGARQDHCGCCKRHR